MNAPGTNTVVEQLLHVNTLRHFAAFGPHLVTLPTLIATLASLDPKPDSFWRQLLVFTGIQYTDAVTSTRASEWVSQGVEPPFHNKKQSCSGGAKACVCACKYQSVYRGVWTSWHRPGW